MYHQVGVFAPMRTHRANYCDHRRFAAQMALLAHLGYRVLSLDEGLAGLRGERPLPVRAVILTFDDAYDNFAEYAWPVLERHGFPATVYAISAWLGQRADWFAKDPGRPIPTLMTAARLRALHATGLIAIGSHSVDHLRLATLDPEAQRRQLVDSRSALEDILGAPVRHLCYPFGSFDRTTVQLAEEAGYVSATTCLRGAAGPEDHPLVLPRKAISFGDNLLGYWWKLAIKHAPKPELVEWRRRLAKAPASS
ncbi:polysaccharide deacetylase family protein [Thermochromatium tepidum]|nr:polysaccharide deacetylase family protein [Thermochromatium tepidum]